MYPSGDPAPSRADIEMTHEITDAATFTALEPLRSAPNRDTALPLQ